MEQEQVDMVEGDGVINMRMQPMQIGHYSKYLKKCLRRIKKGNKLYIGVGRPFFEEKSKEELKAMEKRREDIHRYTRESNPYDTLERIVMALAAVAMDPEVSDRLDDIVVIPFPMSKEEKEDLDRLIKVFFPEPAKVTQFMNKEPGVEWEDKKWKMMESYGFNMVDIYEKEEGERFSGTEFRMIMNGMFSEEDMRKEIERLNKMGYNIDTSDGIIDWTKFVAKGTAEIIKLLQSNPSAIKDITREGYRVDKCKNMSDYLSLLPEYSANTIAKETLAKTPQEQQPIDVVKEYQEQIMIMVLSELYEREYGR